MAVGFLPQSRFFRKSPSVIGRYLPPGWPWYVPLLGYIALALAAALYGYFFGLYGERQVAPFFAPIAAVAAIAMWVMPELRHPPVRLLGKLLIALLFALLIWPDYIALSTTALPWITAVRITAVPMSFILMVCALGSARFRSQMGDVLGSEKLIVWLLIGFMIVTAFSIVPSQDKGSSLARLFVAFYAWFSVFFASAYYFRKPGRVRRFAGYLIILAAFSIWCGLYESYYRQLPWKGRIPSFLTIDDPRIDTVLAGISRAASGKYRVQSKFGTSLGLGEFLGMAFPFILHLFFITRKAWLKLVILIMIPLAFYVVIQTDSRLAFICFLSALMLYLLYHAFNVWRTKRSSIFAPAFMMAYPVGLAVFMMLALTWKRLGNMIFGGGAQQFSSAGRHDQLNRGLPMILDNPLGYGIGQGARTLGYYAPGSTEPTVDNYFLGVALEFGVIGFVLYYLMFGWAAFRSGTAALTAKDKEVMFLGAASISLINFIISKWVYSQQENHPLAFMVLGLTVALLRRAKAEQGKLPPVPDEDELVAPEFKIYVPPPAPAAPPQPRPA